MHIPDGYLSLQTSLPALGAMVPIWSLAVKKIKKSLNHRLIPFLSLCAAFSFVIMMFNVPLGASSVHAIGAVFIAILLGPWAACIAVSVALVIQAFVFGDGGVLAIGANCFNMAFVMPFAGYCTYRIIAGNSNILSKRSTAGIFAGSYIGLNTAALLTAIEFGIQPLLFQTAEGIPEFGFYPLSVSVPAIMSEHLLIAGPVEGIITVSTIAYLAKFGSHLLEKPLYADNSKKVKTSFLSRYRPFIVVLLAMIVLTPLGLLAAGAAWGEWKVEAIRKMIGFVPAGLERFSALWRAILPNYTIPGFKNGFFQSSLGYMVSAAAGILIITSVMCISSRFIVRKEDRKESEK